MSLSALLVAIFSLCLSAYGAHYARERERLLARPRYLISFYFDETGVGWKDSNIGLGPARIRGIHLFLDDVPQARPKLFSRPFKQLFQIPGPVPVKFLNLEAGEIIKPDESDTLIWVPSGPEAEKVRVGYERVRLEVCYCSIYDECWLFQSWTGQITGKRDDACGPFAQESESLWWEP